MIQVVRTPLAPSGQFKFQRPQVKKGFFTYKSLTSLMIFHEINTKKQTD